MSTGRPRQGPPRPKGIGPGASRVSANSAGEYVFGCATLFVGLAVLATLPVLQLMSLGYLLEAAGRVARTGRVTAGLIGVRKAARLGSIVLGTWLLLLPLRLVSLLSGSARLIEPNGGAERFWAIVLWALTAFFVLHVAMLAGGVGGCAASSGRDHCALCGS